MAKAKYRLTYFDMRGVGESIRLIFAAAGVSFEDVQLPWEEWIELKSKKKMGHGQMPILHIYDDDGGCPAREMTQSLAIGRYLGKKFNLFPRDEFLAAKCDEVVDFLTEVRLEFKQLFFEEDATRKAEMRNEFKSVIAPKYYQILSELIDETKDGPFICGQPLMWADCFVANWVEILEEQELGEAFTNKYLVLKGLKEAAYAVPGIKRHIEVRPKTLI